MFVTPFIVSYVGRNRKKKHAGNICKGTLNIEFEQDQSVGLVAKLGDG